MPEVDDHYCVRWIEQEPLDLSPGDEIKGVELYGLPFKGKLKTKPQVLENQRYPDFNGAWFFYLEEATGHIFDVMTKSPIEKSESFRHSL